MQKVKKRTLIFFAIALALCLLGSLGASLVQSGFGSVDVKNYNNQTMAEIIAAIDANNAAGGKDIKATFTTSTTDKMTDRVLIPDTATA